MSKENLVTWLRNQQSILETILLQSAEEYYAQYGATEFFAFDAYKTGQELWHLGNGQDLCYDRPTIGFNYSLWYHPKRVNTFLQYFTDLIYEERETPSIELFDLGAGTGAVQWAAGLVAQGLSSLQLPCPKIKVINIDTSPFMLEYNRKYLWKYFLQAYPSAETISGPNDYQLHSWTNLHQESVANMWLCASYLFDHSDNAAEITADFKELVNQHKPNKVLLLTSHQDSKVQFCNAVSEELQQLNYRDRTQTLNRPIFHNALEEINAFRHHISTEHDLGLIGTPKWNIDSLYGKILDTNTPQLGLGLDSLKLYVQPERDRSKILLSPQQRDAAHFGNRPTLVIGPAGCGKSVVLTQKVKNILDAHSASDRYNPSMRILVTTFNKGLIRTLGDWILQLLDQEKVQRRFELIYGRESDHSFFRFTDSPQDNIYVMHFDLLPTRIGGLHGAPIAPKDVGIEEYHYNEMRLAVEAYVANNRIDSEKFAKILDSEFLLDEYHRIIYGHEIKSLKAYQTIEREGRGNNPQLKFNSPRRRIVWGIIQLYLQRLRHQHYESFTVRRYRFINRLREQGYADKFSHILIDEFQDCTKADYEIFYQLLKDPNNITFAGDLAQAINLGTSLRFPERTENPNMRRFDPKRLQGSFRLPMRISECIRPFSEQVSTKFQNRMGVQADIIIPYKGAPPGSRPILVFAETDQQAADKVAQVFHAYNPMLELTEITIFEKDHALTNGLRERGIETHAEIILRTKGLEKRCVLWSTRIDIQTKTEIEEFVYTILTRTVSLLIIVVYPELRQAYANIIQQFVRSRLILWDKITEQFYNQTIQTIQAEDDVDDVDDSEDVEIGGDENLDELVL